MNPLEELRAEYRRALPPKLEELKSLLRAGRFAELRRALHTLAGSAGSFGLKGVSAAARDAEACLEQDKTPDAAASAEIGRLIDVICSTAASGR